MPACHPRCTCTSSSGAWPTSTPKVCVTVTSSPRTCLWTLTLLSSSSAILAGRSALQPVGPEGVKGLELAVGRHPALLFTQCKAAGSGRAQCVLHLLSVLPCSRAHLWSHRLHLIHRSVGAGAGAGACQARGLGPPAVLTAAPRPRRPLPLLARAANQLTNRKALLAASQS